MRFAVVLPLLFLVPIDSGPGGPTKPSDPGVAHSDQIEAYALMIAGATRAEKVCTGRAKNERGRLWASLALVNMPLRIGGKLNPTAVALFEAAAQRHYIT
jgi:hypothetical protein